MRSYAFLEQVRAQPGLAALPAIAISGMRRDGDMARVRAAGFSAHLDKPVSFDRLNAIVHELLPRRAPNAS